MGTDPSDTIAERPPPVPSRWRPTDALVAEVRERLAGVVVLGLVAVAALAVWWWRGSVAAPPAPVESVLPQATAASAPSPRADGSQELSAAATPAEAGLVVVHVTGAVRHPGVYQLAAGERIQDLVQAAGGLTTAADPNRINLAAPVADGSQVWIPALGQEQPALVAPMAPAAPPVSGGSGDPVTQATMVDLNAADAAGLEALPGIGPSLAAAIVAYRDEHGPFAVLEDLLQVPGIGPAKLEQLRPAAVIGGR